MWCNTAQLPPEQEFPGPPQPESPDARRVQWSCRRRPQAASADTAALQRDTSPIRCISFDLRRTHAQARRGQQGDFTCNYERYGQSSLEVRPKAGSTARLRKLALVSGDRQGRNRTSCAYGRSPLTTENAPVRAGA